MANVEVNETPGGDQPLAKAQGVVVGWQTQLDEARAYATTAQGRLARVDAESAARHADAQANLERAEADVARLEAELDAARGALPVAEAEQAAHDAVQG